MDIFGGKEIYLEGMKSIWKERNVFRGNNSIWREQNLFGGNEMYFEGTMLISRERNVFRGNEMYFEGTKYISMERNNISEFPHVPLGAPYIWNKKADYNKLNNMLT